MNIKYIIKKYVGQENINAVRNLKYVLDDIRIIMALKQKREMNYKILKKEVLKYVDSLKVGDYQYRFSQSVVVPSLYASVYACLIRGVLNDINENEKEGWLQYFDSFQRKDGLFVDPLYATERFFDGDGWGARHLVPHILIAYNRLGGVPRYPLGYLDVFCDKEWVEFWLQGLDFSEPWATSNEIFNYMIALQYARDFLNQQKYAEVIEFVEEWLMEHMLEECSVWTDGDLSNRYNQYNAARGAYHIYPILVYDGIHIPEEKKTLKFLMNLQNKWGGFDIYNGSSACDDIDVIEPIIRIACQANYRSDNVERVLKKAQKWVYINQNRDGGFVFSRHGKFQYGDASVLSSKRQESNLFGTWFRLISLLYIEEYMQTTSSTFSTVPGYEFRLICKEKNDKK